MSFTLSDIAIAEENIKDIDRKNDTDILSYNEFITYFKDINVINAHNFIIGVHFIYGWMPTILKLNVNNININHDVLCVLNVVKKGERISEDNLVQLSKVINNSIVGTSKLLHFINPNIYAIWDSRVCEFIYNHTNRVYDIKAYMEYLLICDAVANEVGFNLLHNKINKKIGYPVTALRAIEWVAYQDTLIKRKNRVYSRNNAAQQSGEADGSPFSR